MNAAESIIAARTARDDAEQELARAQARYYKAIDESGLGCVALAKTLGVSTSTASALVIKSRSLGQHGPNYGSDI